MNRNILRCCRSCCPDHEHQAQGGWFLVSALVMIVFLSAVGIAAASLASEQYQHTVREEYVQNAQLVAEAGIEQSVYELNTNSSFTGYNSPQQFFSDTSQGQGAYTTTVTENTDGKSKTIVSTGNVYLANNTANPYVTRSVRVTVVGTASTGYSVFSGPGGLILSGNANVTNSDVYVGGTISMSGASKIGTYSNPVKVDVANNACPSGSNPGNTYPQVCTNGSQPISLGHNTNIYGSVCATSQTSTGPNNNIQGGNGGSGLQVGCTAPVSSTPFYDRMGQINALNSGGTFGSGNSNTYVCGQSPLSRNWPGNLELTGNVNINGSCNVTVNGNVYITGNLTISGSAKITAADAAGTTTPVIIVDGTITVSGSASMIANSSGTGIEFISFKSDDNCTTATNGSYCTNLSGNDLYNSQSVQTVSVSGNTRVPGMIFDAYWGEATLSGTGQMGAVAGQTVNLNGTGTVIFGKTLSSGTQTWTITSYQPLYSGSG
ncbi:MAG TPA: hypothetical protein VGS08_04185 [Candidatus Saccharimonadales bacterium]|nr:hypothetical protein [Candidatus Saccharimonadales bacterium]